MNKYHISFSISRLVLAIKFLNIGRTISSISSNTGTKQGRSLSTATYSMLRIMHHASLAVYSIFIDRRELPASTCHLKRKCLIMGL
jgi:hypothetical protein